MKKSIKSSIQQTIITLTDNPDGTVTFNLEFKPSVKSDESLTPAMQTALMMIETLKENLNS